jgi:hypothetical protein
LRHQPPSLRLKRLIDLLARILEKKNTNTLLFKNPDATAIGDNEVMEDLNKKLAINKDMKIPK